MSRRRRGLGGWLSRLKTWHQVGIFVVAAGGLGSVVWTAASGVERQTGLMAENFGFARSVDVSGAVEDLKAWQLYSDIRRLKRQIFDLKVPVTERDRERFEDLQTQLTTIQTEYDRITKGRRR